MYKPFDIDAPAGSRIAGGAQIRLLRYLLTRSMYTLRLKWLRLLREGGNYYSRRGRGRREVSSAAPVSAVTKRGCGCVANDVGPLAQSSVCWPLYL